MSQNIKISNKTVPFNCPNCWGYQEYNCSTSVENKKKVSLGWILDYVENKLS